MDVHYLRVFLFMIVCTEGLYINLCTSSFFGPWAQSLNGSTFGCVGADTWRRDDTWEHVVDQ